MIRRIVRMHFHEAGKEEFLVLFDQVSQHIRGQKGCHALCLYEDVADPCILYTDSLWETEGHLEAYRGSQLFRDTWRKTKLFFAQKAAAWSMEEIRSVHI